MAANSITVTALQLITAAMQEIGALAGGETPSNDDQAWVLQKLQRLIDRYNADRTKIYNVGFQTFTLPASTQPITMGPGAQFDMNQRPVEIPSIGLMLLNTDPQVKLYLNRRDQAWWAANRVPQLTSTLPTDYYYSPDWPNGNLYLWPIPTQVNDLLIEMRTVLAEITAYQGNGGTFSLPPGYWDAVVYSLAVEISPSFQKPVGPDLRLAKDEAVRTITMNNVKSPRGRTGDAGMPGIGARSGWNYYDALPTNDPTT